MTYRIEGGGTAVRTKTATKPSTTTLSSPTTSTYLTKEAMLDQAYSTGRSPGVSASWAPPPPQTVVPPAPTPTTVAPPPTTTKREPETGTSPITVDPVAPPTQTGGQIADATAFDSGTLQQILTALEAKYGLSREQLLAEQGEVGRLYRFVNANLGRMEQDAQRGLTENSLGRGILRSGIHLENAANVERDFTERRAQAEGEKATKLAYIQNQLSTLQSELEAERMQKSQQFGQRGMEFARQYASTF